MYLTYEEYESMGGTLEESDFEKYLFEAEARINWVTFNRLKNDTVFPDEVKKLDKYLIDKMQERAALASPGTSSTSLVDAGQFITSQSNDGVSVSYNAMPISDLLKSLDEDVDNTINMFLYGVMNEAGRKLLYRGLYPGE